MIKRLRGVTLGLVLLLEVGACKKSEKSEKTETTAADPAAAPAAPAAATAPAPAEPAAPAENNSPWGKPSLSDDKLERYIKSLSEKSPFDEKPHSFEESKALAPKQDAFAKKYGFASGEEYSDVVQRVTMGTMTLGVVEGAASTRASLVEALAAQEKQLADPALTAEAKAQLTETITASKGEIARLDADAKSMAADQTGMNAPDLALVKKYGPKISAAEKAKLDLK